MTDFQSAKLTPMINKPIYFISDLHLGDAHPQTLDAFERFIDIKARSAHALYILGDLFEAWVGDDNDSVTAHRVADRLKHLTEQGVPVYFMPGNRDFLVGATYLKLSGMTLLSDPTVVSLDGHPVLLTHGDLFCTGDIGYQRYRRIVHQAWVQTLFLMMPRFVRDFIGQRLRNRPHHKPMSMMDVDENTVNAWARQYQIDNIIHGHTHQPHEHVQPTFTRYVLGAWDDGHPKILIYSRGAFLLSEI